MAADKEILSLLKHSSALVRESVKAKASAERCLSTSSVIIDQSKHLLATWPISGIPTFPQEHYLQEMAGTPLPSPAADDYQAPAATPGSALERVEGQRFAETTVRLDGRHYVDCIVENCILEYWGGPVVLEGTEFSGCRFNFAGEAAMTVSVLQCFGLFAQSGDTPNPAPSKTAKSTHIN